MSGSTGGLDEEAGGVASGSGQVLSMPPQKQPPTNPLSHRRSFWTAIVEEDDINSLVTSVESTLTDCLRLEQEACPAKQGNREMMLLFKEAVEEFQTVLFEILKRKKAA
ncbi:UNVERIFIED_CONTAM: hypothetical protein FKN15_057480 [Acipenser sinensis]